MAKKLQVEIRQTREFSSLEEEAWLNLRRSADILHHQAMQFFRTLGLTETQYNVLLILRGAGEEGLRCSEIGPRLISKDPDITRLLARLQKQKLVRRRHDAKDRRIIYANMTPEGLALLEEFDPAVKQEVKRLLEHLGTEKLAMLIDLLEEARAPYLAH